MIIKRLLIICLGVLILGFSLLIADWQYEMLFDEKEYLNCHSIRVNDLINNFMYEVFRENVSARHGFYIKTRLPNINANGQHRFTKSADTTKNLIVYGNREYQFLHIVWSKLDRNSCNYEIYYNCSVNTTEWIYGTNGYRITYTNRPSLYPAVAGYSWLPSVHCVWQEGEGDSAQIWYSRSPDNGRTWADPIFLAMGEHPDIAVDHQGVHIVFSRLGLYPEDEMPQFVEPEIYYINSPDFGITWKPITRLTTAIYNSENSKIVKD